jgi:haloalkane dehalogenase
MTHIAAQQPTQPPPNLATSAGSAWAHEKRFADVLDRRMAYVERGAGHPIVLLHGNPTSSFLWRNVLPHIEAPGRRPIVPDLIGMGDSDKIPAGAEPDRYRFAGHARYLAAFITRWPGPSR